MLSNTSDYALRAALVLARAYGARTVRADEVAAATGTPRNYMAKVLNGLAKSGLVTSARGPAGGFMLAEAPQNVTLAEVIDVFDEPRRHTRCLLGNGPCNPLGPCAAHQAWSAVMVARRDALVKLTLADLLSGRGGSFGPDASVELPSRAAFTA